MVVQLSVEESLQVGLTSPAFLFVAPLFKTFFPSYLFPFFLLPTLLVARPPIAGQNRRLILKLVEPLIVGVSIPRDSGSAEPPAKRMALARSTHT